jgi:hypothetical protein
MRSAQSLGMLQAATSSACSIPRAFALLSATRLDFALACSAPSLSEQVAQLP